MKDSRPTTVAPILVALAIVLLPLGVYVGGYFGLGQCVKPLTSSGPVPETMRLYSAQWHYQVFRPLAWLESRITRGQVTLVYEENGDFLEAFSIGGVD